MIELIKVWDSKYNFKVKCTYCDDAGENVSLKKACEEEGLGVIFEYAAP